MRNPLAAHQIPSGNQGLRFGPLGSGDLASKWLFDRGDPAKRRYLRRNEPVRVQFPQLKPDGVRSRGMNPSGNRHIPVLGRQAVELLLPRDGGIYVDATFGAGGYSGMILDAAKTLVIGIDRDRSAISSRRTFTG